MYFSRLLTAFITSPVIYFVIIGFIIDISDGDYKIHVLVFLYDYFCAVLRVDLDEELKKLLPIRKIPYLYMMFSVICEFLQHEVLEMQDILPHGH